MIWQPLATIQTVSNWILTESIIGSLFRITHSVNGTNPQSLRSVIAQTFDEDENNSYFDFKRLAYKPETEILEFVQPQGLLNRKLAIKRLDDSPNNWTITIEVFQPVEIPLTTKELITNIKADLEQIKMTLTNPITVNIPSNQEILSNVISNIIPVPTNIGIATVLVAANEGRRGLTLFNHSVGSVLIDFGKAPTPQDYAVLIAPQGYYELPYIYTGEIQGLWADSGGIGVVVREFVNYNPEPVA